MQGAAPNGTAPCLYKKANNLNIEHLTFNIPFYYLTFDELFVILCTKT